MTAPSRPTAEMALRHLESVDDPLGKGSICAGCLGDWPCDFERGRRSTPRPEPRCTCEPEHVWPCAILPRCDEPGCDAETSCGFPSPTGYRRTCGRHYRDSLPTVEALR